MTTAIMTNKTNWPDDAREEAQKALSAAQDTAQDAVRSGEKYLRENPIPVIFGALLIGAVLGALLRPPPRKEPDAVQAVRDWVEKTLEELAAKWPKALEQARAIQDDLRDQAQDLRKKLSRKKRSFWSRW
jgi:ElaB/YqjD/DUF883 family membrane-anchored ribosome-binding protein